MELSDKFAKRVTPHTAILQSLQNDPRLPSIRSIQIQTIMQEPDGICGWDHYNIDNPEKYMPITSLDIIFTNGESASFYTGQDRDEASALAAKIAQSSGNPHLKNMPDAIDTTFFDSRHIIDFFIGDGDSHKVKTDRCRLVLRDELGDSKSPRALSCDIRFRTPQERQRVIDMILTDIKPYKNMVAVEEIFGDEDAGVLDNLSRKGRKYIDTHKIIAMNASGFYACNTLQYKPGSTTAFIYYGKTGTIGMSCGDDMNKARAGLSHALIYKPLLSLNPDRTLFVDPYEYLGADHIRPMAHHFQAHLMEAAGEYMGENNQVFYRFHYRPNMINRYYPSIEHARDAAQRATRVMQEWHENPGQTTRIGPAPHP